MTAGRPLVHWTPEQDAKLRKYWADGWTCSQIGAALGFTRSAVSGRAHRLKLTRRISPILASPEKVLKTKLRRKSISHTAYQEAIDRLKAREPRRLDRTPQGGRETDHRAELPARAEPASEPILRPGTECSWLEGDRPNWVKCGATCQAGSSYCPEHHVRVYAVGLAADRQIHQGAAHDGTISSGSRRWNVKRSELKWGA